MQQKSFLVSFPRRPISGPRFFPLDLPLNHLSCRLSSSHIYQKLASQTKEKEDDDDGEKKERMRDDLAVKKVASRLISQTIIILRKDLSSLFTFVSPCDSV